MVYGRYLYLLWFINQLYNFGGTTLYVSHVMLGVHWEGSEWQDAARREKSLLERPKGDST
jgi:hypothetical protein